MASTLPRAGWRLPRSLAASGNGGSGSRGSEDQRPLAKQKALGGEARARPKVSAGGGEAGEGGPARRRRGGRRRRGTHTGKTWGSKDRNLHALILTMAKLLLQNAQKIRRLSASATDTITLPIKHAVVQALGDELELYKNQIEHFRKDKAMNSLAEKGPPTAGLTVAMMESLVTCDIGGATKEKIKAWLALVQPPSSEEMAVEPESTKADIETRASFLRVEPCHDKEFVKLQIAMNRWGQRTAVLGAFRAEGVDKVLTGVAPPGWLEEELGTWAGMVQTA
ncbi:unnamed protein product [Prorocentrum cordatum]|uniref:Uncharacterized protein n=1 Tax=Prorocentrum cordatum TaxID=2364126 RepID=A0ABN9VN69_9DINO|nr:unnamed protein product [Polarella glacialis]